MNELPYVTSDFLDENQKFSQIKPKSKKGGPYSKIKRESRRNKIYKLHFDYGYSARKIATLLKINRNTINVDISFWYSRIIQSISCINPEVPVLISLQRLEIQRSRLREQLDKSESSQERLALERLLIDIESKISYTYIKLCGASQRVNKMSTEILNEWMKANNKSDRYVNMFAIKSVSVEANEKINKIISEDRLHGRHL